MSTIYDPSDIRNKINGFNVVSCCHFKPVDMYVMIPNIGYGFAAHVLETFLDSLNSITPAQGFSIQLSPDPLGDIQKEYGVSISVSSRKFFAPIGTSTTSDYITMKIPLNSHCARKVSIEKPLRLPLAFKVHNISDNEGFNKVMQHCMVKDAGFATYGLCTSAIGNSSDDNDPIQSALAATHFRAASDLLCNKPDNEGTYPDPVHSWTGKRHTDSERVEYTHLFNGEGGALLNMSYFDIVGKNTSTVSLAECILRPAVFVSFEIQNGRKRVFFSEELTRKLIPKIRIEGKAQPPKLIFGRTTYTLGLSTENQLQCQPWLRHCAIGDELTQIPYDDLVTTFLSSHALQKSDVHSEFSCSKIPYVTAIDRTTGSGEQTYNCVLYTAGPPLFTNGEIYRDNHKDASFYVPFSHTYLLPLAVYNTHTMTGLRLLDVSDIENLSYRDKETYQDKSLLYHHEGFAHVAHSIFCLYELLQKPDITTALHHIGTVKLESVEESVVSRWLYAPLDPTKTLKSASHTWVKKISFDDATDFLPAFLIGTDWEHNQAEWNNPLFSNLAQHLTHEPEMQQRGGKAALDFLSAASNFSSATTVVVPEKDMFFTHITTGSAHTIQSNSSADTIPAVKGATITTNPIKNDNRGLYAGDMRFTPLRPSVNPAGVALSPDSELSVTAVLSNSIAVDEKLLCTSSKELLTAIHQMTHDISTIITDSLIIYDTDQKKIVSPEPQYEIDTKEFPQAHTFNTSVEILTETLDTTKPALQALQSALHTYESTPAIRPVGFEKVIANGITTLKHTVPIISSIANGILGGYRDGTEQRITLIARTTNDTSIGLGISLDALGKGFHLYNIRKTYLVISSIFSLLAATVERLIIYLHAFSRTYSPFPAFEANEWRDLDIFAFMSSANELCYPEVTKDIALPGDLVRDTVKLNRVSQIFEDSSIRYTIKLTIADHPAHAVHPIVLPGFGISQDGESWFNNWETSHKYPFEPHGEFSKLTGDIPLLNMETDLELAPLSIYNTIQRSISKSDYMIYNEQGIRYISESGPTTREISSMEFGSLLQKGMQSECPAIAKTLVEGEISMTDIFPYLTPSTTVTVTVPPFFGFTAPFYTGHPYRTSETVISAGSLTSTDTTIWQFDETQMPRNEICEELATARNMITNYLRTGRIIHVLFNKRKAYCDSGKPHGEYPEVLFALVSLADTSLNTTTAYHHQENALSAFLLKEAAGSEYTALNELGTGNSLDDEKIINDMSPVDHRWIDNQTPATSPVSSTERNQHRRNYNTWLSKRRSYYTLKMLISSFISNLIDCGELDTVYTDTAIDAIGSDNEIRLLSHTTHTRDYSAPPYPEYQYTVELIYSKDGSEPAILDPSCEVVLKPFHLYGYGGMFAPPNTSDRPGRKHDRVTKMLIHDYQKNDAYFWGFTHEGRDATIPLAIGKDLETTSSSSIPAGITEDIIRGSYTLPVMSNKDRWLITPAYGATAEELNNEGSAIQNTFTDNLYNYMYTYVAEGSLSTAIQQQLKRIAKNITPIAVSSVWSHISRFLYEKPQVWACRREGDILHNKIFLKITQTT